MPLTPDLSSELGQVGLGQVFGEAVKLFDAGDLHLAFRYFTAYVSAGEPKQDAARDYLRKIGEHALALGKAYHSAQLLRQAMEHYTLAMKTPAEKPAEEAGTLLRTIPPPKLREFEADGPATPANASDETREWRRPHMKLSKDDPLLPGDAFDVKVFANQSDPQPGEESNAIDLPAGKKVYTLEVELLASAHFRVDEPQAQPFHIERGKTDTEEITFHATVVDAAELQGLAGRPASLCAVFRYRGRPAGKVRRQIELAGARIAAAGASSQPAVTPPGESGGPSGLAEPAVRPPRRDSISIEPNASPADLTVTIEAQAENDDRHFWCVVQTKLLPEYSRGVREEWITKTDTGEIVSRYMQDFTAAGITPFQRLTRLRGAGIELFNASPRVFQDAFWKLIDANAKLKTIAIVSAELYIPWELMIPNRGARDALPAERRRPLGVEFRIGRMNRASLVSGTQILPLTASCVIAPVFEGPNALPHAQEEAQFILKEIPGSTVDPATLQTIDQRLKICPSLVHFACHGEVDAGGQQTLYLSDNESISELELRGLYELAEGVGKARPLVFLNACKAGQPVPALVGAGGLAAVFTDLGAGAVVAPLWSVKDTIAHQIALEFYTEAKSQKPVVYAEIIRNLRAKAYDEPAAEDSYAAYCFYGDPLATPA